MQKQCPPCPKGETGADKRASAGYCSAAAAAAAAAGDCCPAARALFLDNTQCDLRLATTESLAWALYL